MLALTISIVVCAQTLEKAYEKWANEDVVYIITDEERALWDSLESAEARLRFIEIFWLRHDPTPDTIENEFRDEHYRRMVYANEHFGTNVPGWRTDRGRIYIIYGPPDDIHSALNFTIDRASGAQSTARHKESWRYRHIDGVGDNVSLDFVAADDAQFTLSSDALEAGREAEVRKLFPTLEQLSVSVDGIVQIG